MFLIVKIKEGKDSEQNERNKHNEFSSSEN